VPGGPRAGGVHAPPRHSGSYLAESDGMEIRSDGAGGR
jgi:hypothetical protein